MDDSQVLKCANETTQGFKIEDPNFAQILEESFQLEIESALEITNAPIFEEIGEPRPDVLDDSLMESVEAAEDPEKLQFDSCKNRSPEFAGIWKSPRSNSSVRKRLRDSSFMDENPSENSKFHNFSVNDTESPEPFPVGAGLANMGNTCFLNAILQCFTHTVPLVQGLLSLKHDPSSHADEFCIICAVRCQIELSLEHSGRVISPSNLVDNLSHISSFFQRYQQEDAHEFLQCLLDKLDSNWSKYDRNEKDSSSASIDSLVNQIFGGRIVSQVRCCKCGHNSDTYESLIDLSLEIENVDNLESALKSFTKVESIEDTENFTCEGCKEKVPVEKQLILDQAPSVAALHLKRFKSDGVFIEKNDKKVDYPLELDLQPYTNGAEDRKEELKYELFGVVVHVGLSSTSGHYFCYIRTAPDTWYRFDDSKVTRVSEATALCQDAYILFYAKKGTEYFSSFFEKWKASSEQKNPTTSPKSVLHDMDLPSTSTRTFTAPCSPSRQIDHDEVKIDRPDFDHQFSSGKKVNGKTCSPSYISPVFEIDPCTPPRSPSPDKYFNEELAEARSRIPVEHVKVEYKTPSAKVEYKTPSAKVEDKTPSAKVEDKTPSAKQTMEMKKHNLKRNEAVKFMSKSMPSSRRNMLTAAMMGPQNKSDNTSFNKRRKQVAASLW